MGAGNQLLSWPGQMWSSLTVIHEKRRLFITQTDDPAWGRADDVGSSFVHQGCSSFCVGQPRGGHQGGCALVPRCVHGICGWTLSTDDGISVRNFYHLELKSPRGLCKYKLCSSKDVAYYWLNPVVQLPTNSPALPLSHPHSLLLPPHQFC